MKSYKARGIVLRTMKYGEADKIITLLTAERGKVGAIAKGVRRPKSKFGARLEPFSDVELVLHHGRNLDTVTQAQLIDAHQDVRDDLDRLTCGYGMLEFADKVSSEKHADDKTYRLLGAALSALGQATEPRLVLLAYDLKLLAVSGFLPNLRSCVTCGSSERLSRLSAAHGGLLCDACDRQDATATKLPGGGHAALADLLYRPLAEADNVAVDESVRSRIEAALQSHIRWHLHTDLKLRNGPVLSW